MAFNNYLEKENDKPYFTKNSLAYYYDKMEGFAKAVEGSAKALNLTKEEVEKRITFYIEQNKNELDQRLAQWDGKLETFDSSVETLLTEWVNDGTLAHVIDGTLIDQRIAPVAEKLTDTARSAGKPPGHSVWTEFEQRGVNVTWFGAVADANYYDETTQKYYTDSSKSKPAKDNRLAFQNAVDFLTASGGGTLYVPKGNYCFRGTVYWKTKVSMKGSGTASTKFVTEGTIFSLFDGTVGASDGSSSADPSIWFEDCHFEDFQCDLRGLTHTEPSVGGKAFFILYMRRGRFHNLFLQNTIGTALGCDFLDDTVISNVVTNRAGRNSIATGGYGGNSGIGIGTDALAKEPVVVSNCHTYNSGNYGVFVESQNNIGHMSKYAKIINCHAQGCKTGFGNKGAGSTQFIGCTAVENELGIILSQHSSGDKVISCTIEKNVIDGIMITADYLGTTIISNNTILSNGQRGINIINSNTGSRDAMMINNNIVARNGLQGILVTGNAKNISINENTVFENGQLATPSNQLRGIALSNTITGANISNNTFYDNQEVKTQTVAIQIGSAVTDYIVDGNIFSGYTASTALSDANKTGIVTNDNIGILREVSGTISFAEGEVAIYINHFLGQPVKSIQLTPLGNEKVWVTANTESNRIRIQRETIIGTLGVMYEIKL